MLTKTRGVLSLFLTFLVPAVDAAPLPAVLGGDVRPFSQVGAGEGRKFGFHIYDASLWTQDSQLSVDPLRLAPQQPVVLHIQYRRNINSQRLVAAAVDAWKVMPELDTNICRAWANRIATMWPDVKPGDSITTLVVPNTETRFYSKDRKLGVIDDPAFGPAFLAIWLDPRSQHGQLRAALLGQQGRTKEIAHSPISKTNETTRQ